MALVLIFLLGMLVVVLATGLAAFAHGGDWYRRHARLLMNLRVGGQLLAALVVGGFMLGWW